MTTPEPLSAGLMTILRLLDRSWRAWRSSKARFFNFDRKMGRSLRAAVLAVMKLAKDAGGCSVGTQFEGGRKFRWSKPSSSLEAKASFSSKKWVRRRERWSLSTASRALLRLHSPGEGQNERPFFFSFFYIRDRLDGIISLQTLRWRWGNYMRSNPERCW